MNWRWGEQAILSNLPVDAQGCNQTIVNLFSMLLSREEYHHVARLNDFPHIMPTDTPGDRAFVMHRREERRIVTDVVGKTALRPHMEGLCSWAGVRWTARHRAISGPVDCRI